MKKIKISINQLERINYPQSSSPKELYIEQELSYYNSGSYTHYYKCPCGKGRVIDDKDATPGYRSHDVFFECDDCRNKYEF